MNAAFQYTHCGPIIVPVFCLTGEYTTYFLQTEAKVLLFYFRSAIFLGTTAIPVAAWFFLWTGFVSLVCRPKPRGLRPS
ncbi:hypothetical protein CLU79DRAFT_731156 [Phycomyces nitens]|nr:hypothetical protein CLU79DRAFT_731156 [Phycomyces nitens]